MPIFARRKLQLMLDDMAPYLTPSKSRDLFKRLEHQNTDQALPAEYEIGLMWGVSKVAHLQVEPQFGNRAPDIYSDDFLRGDPSAIEIVAISDDALGDESVMRRAANVINAVAGKYLKGVASHLYFEFLEESGYEPVAPKRFGTRYYRRRRVTRDFKVSSEFEGAIKTWLAGSPPDAPLRWEDGSIGVVIKWQDYVHPHGNTFSSMPPVCYDARDNPLYETLKSKIKQLAGVPTGIRKGIFLCDAGCSLLRDIRPIFGGGREVRGDEVIQTFVKRHPADFVVVFVPRRQSEHSLWYRDNPRQWHTYIYSKELPEADFQKVAELAEILPDPYLHGYQARSWHQQGMFNPQARGRYLGTTWTSGRTKMTAKISARALQELMAGRMTPKQFQHHVMGEHNLFEAQLQRGLTISAVGFESSGSDKDDDYVTFEFEEDPAAAPLRDPLNQPKSTD